MTKIEIIQYEGDDSPRKKLSSDTSFTNVILWKFVDFVTDDVPTYDASTHKIQTNEAYDGVNWKRSYTVVEKTQTEKEAYINRQTLLSGYDTGDGYSLAIDESDQNAFARLLTFLREAGISDDTDVTIKDNAGIKRTMTYAELKTLLVQYGLYCQQLFNNS